jgi:hypothetical protein
MVLAVSAGAAAHQFGYHTTVDLVVRRSGMTALVTMDVPRGKESLLQRMEADRNGDHQLDADERQALKANLIRLAIRRLEIRRAGRVVIPEVKEGKVYVSESTAVDESPVSVAAILEYPESEGDVEVRDEAPDALPVPARISFEPSSQPPIEGTATGALPLRGKPPW